MAPSSSQVQELLTDVESDFFCHSLQFSKYNEMRILQLIWRETSWILYEIPTIYLIMATDTSFLSIPQICILYKIKNFNMPKIFPLLVCRGNEYHDTKVKRISHIIPIGFSLKNIIDIFFQLRHQLVYFWKTYKLLC